MEAYTDFARVYDIFMDETPYEQWADFLISLIETYGISKPVRGDLAPEKGEDGILSSERNLVVDLGCGTGTLTELLAKRGYDMIGVDNSQEMLEAALLKKQESGSEILYLCQDMQELNLYSTVGTVISICDSVNYLLRDEEVEKTFWLVNNYLYPGGLFVFDFNTVYKYEQVIGDATIAENRESCSFIWENYYHPKQRINEYDLTIFVREERGPLKEQSSRQQQTKPFQPELFRRFSETHFQRGYTPEEMTGFVERAGMQVVQVLDADTHGPVTDVSERVYVIARECQKWIRN